MKTQVNPGRLVRMAHWIHVRVEGGWYKANAIIFNPWNHYCSYRAYWSASDATPRLLWEHQ
jgi:hypothetical protein